MNKNKIVIILLTVLCVCMGIFGASAAERLPVFSGGEASVQEETARQSESGGAQEENTSEKNSADERTAQTEKSDKTTAAGNENSSGEAERTQTRTTAAPENSTKTQTTAPSSEINIVISITCKNALAYAENLNDEQKQKQKLLEKLPQSGYILQSTNFTAQQGDTVFDLLSAVCGENGISLQYQSKSYIQGIGGLAEKDCGGSGGWMYRVNGAAPSKGASKYNLSDGDVVEWYYVTGPGDR